ncbi:MAG: alpha/beta fold hydrolase, partial [Pseudomonadota bacterium]
MSHSSFNFFKNIIRRSKSSASYTPSIVAPPFNSGHLSVGDGHLVYFEEWGSKGGVPILVLHGGPGASFNDSHKALFDPRRHHVVLFDQRGCGKSTPSGKLAFNDTLTLLNDIDLVRNHVGFQKPINVAGGSWGATLALLYAEQRPDTVRELLLWSTFLGTKDEAHAPLGKQPLDPNFPHPHAWQQFIKLIPARHRATPAEIIEYSFATLNSLDFFSAFDLAVAYSVYDTATCNSPSFNETATRKSAEDDPLTLIAAKVQLYYFHNNFFIQEGAILTNLPRIRHIRANVVHGRYDWCTLPRASELLRDTYGDRMTLHLVDSG